jgi:predicted deacetylase
MAASYLIRLDDACPTMDHEKWDLIEKVLDVYQIKPIVAVIPNNLDSSMEISPRDDKFWLRVSSWQRKGWAIAMHGETHAMHSTNETQIFPYYNRSEFAGLSREDKLAKISRAYDIFLANGIKPDLWVSPAHCIDQETVSLIKLITPIRCFSDGIAFAPYSAFGASWIPQQLWSYKWRPFGLWTICLHPNQMSHIDISLFQAYTIPKVFSKSANLPLALVQSVRRINYFERIYAAAFWLRRRKWRFALKTLLNNS